MSGSLFRGLLQQVTGGCGFVLPTNYDDEFDCGSTIDTTGARFSGANAWNDGIGSDAVVISKGLTGGELEIRLGTNGIDFEQRRIDQAFPAGNCTFETRVRHTFSASNALAGFWLQESSTGKAVVFGPGEDAGGKDIRVHNNAVADGNTAVGSWSTEYSADLRVSRSGTNLVFDYDIGAGWVNIVTHAQTTRFTTTPNRIGLIYIHSIANTGNKSAFFQYFRKTA
jgi:hypothetical protein